MNRFKTGGDEMRRVLETSSNIVLWSEDRFLELWLCLKKDTRTKAMARVLDL